MKKAVEKDLKKNRIRRILLISGFLILLVAVFQFTTYSITKYTGYFLNDMIFNKPSDFEVCLDNRDVTLYINSENPSKTLANINLDKYLDNIKIMNCLRDNQACLRKGVVSFPTWIIRDIKIEKDISVYELADYSGCDLI